jgi:hypothetical protein
VDEEVEVALEPIELEEDDALGDGAADNTCCTRAVTGC